MNQTIKKYITNISLVAALLTPQLANAESSAELMAGNNNTTLDVKIATELAQKTNLFIRNKTTVAYDTPINNFGLIDLSYNLVDGLDAVAEGQFIPQQNIIPRAGLQYFKEIGNLSVYILATAGINQGQTDAEGVAYIRYTPPINPDLKLVFSAEDVTNIGSQGHNFSLQSLRAGLGHGKYEGGLGLNLDESAGKINSTVGGSLRINF